MCLNVITNAPSLCYINRFPNDFMFQLTKSELGLLKSQIATSKSAESQQDKVLISQIVTSKPIERRGGTQKPPYAFTRNGIGMFNSVLMGASLKDMGAGLCAVTEMRILPETLLNYIK